MVKAAFFDIDGTIVSFRTHEAPDSAVEALRRMRERGIRLVIATGRSSARLPAPIVELAQQVPFDAYITFNGQYCYTPDGGIIRDVPIGDAAAESIIDGARAGRYDVCVMHRNGSFVNRHSERVLAVERHVGGKMVERDLAHAFDEPIYQFCVYVDPGDEGIFMEGATGVEPTRWCDWFCDVMPAGGGKPAGIADVCAHFGIEPADCIAFGDGGNDISMFGAVGTGVAMGNASDEVKAAADYVTADVDEDGLWRACEHFGLL